MRDTELVEQVCRARRKVVGTKQTLKELERGEVVLVLLAEDADAKISTTVANLAAAKGVKVSYIETMSELGKICGIKVKAATAAIIEF
ncbi:MAG TPA: ribosomal L7Ae/L30e/S12e/Gadd45 family protein [Bacillota bacterium]|nr:ribosomal L7Ae/L30e/S12e/Gadd45 family protein [Bacillota bacterium]HOJ83940.1 ribosomal L7Ae/L30e/S12e/Gadd45 family protein [Bacillota bacterium]HOL15731.1 ribosomal L7Ae/L30e/S12e/Gadd45 family protein [Bacillota bacterium]HPZ12573.1 ribosomal L7Ae/L30e/S12e/Gadd45 family protein [Bacillota bacterium]HQE10922.1 ribosomal L7Ae/L30e/S12e/Gadd45 family protein [Bacillota bacterium]